jgi:type IV pilus biogenesis protein CpaD/CtpE
MIEQPEPQNSPEELAATELRHQLAGLGPDTDRALMVTLRLPSGQFVADIWLSRTDVEALSDACVSIAAHRNCIDDDPAAPLPLAEEDLTDADFADLISEAESILGNGGDA